jgi:hypothetical protein
MFPTPNLPTEGPARRWREGLQRAVGTVVAFATLAETKPAGNRAGEPAPALDADPATRPAALSRTPDPALPGPRTAAAKALARAAARPATVEASAPARGPRPHLHRRALRAPAHSRRPGAVRAAPQPCLTPLPARHAGRGGTPLAPSR